MGRNLYPYTRYVPRRADPIAVVKLKLAVLTSPDPILVGMISWCQGWRRFKARIALMLWSQRFKS